MTVQSFYGETFPQSKKRAKRESSTCRPARTLAFPVASTADRCYDVNMRWTSNLDTGVPLLDEQHRAIFRWLDDLEEATADQRTLLAVYTITRLKHYVRDHFAAEESYMKAAGYPKLAEHMAEHIAFRARLGQLQIESISKDVASATVSFIRDWLIKHISSTDQEYAPYVVKVAEDAWTTAAVSRPPAPTGGNG